MLKADAAVCFALLLIGLSVIFFVYEFEGPGQFALGLLVGCIHSLAKIVLLEKSIMGTLGREKENARNHAVLHFFGRYFLTVAVFVVVVLFNGVFGLFGALAGVLSLQVAAHIANRALRDRDL